VTFTQLIYELRKNVQLIVLNRPDVHNCIGPVLHRELTRAWADFAQNPDAKVAVLSGAGEKAFSSGGDLSSLAELVPQTGEEIDAHNRGERLGLLGPSRSTQIYKPIVAAINGLAHAGGLEWACFADIRIAEEHATFGVTCRRWNVGLADGGTQRLPRIIGLARALELIITGRVIGATEALEIGLVNEVVPKGRSLERALELAECIAALPQEAISTDKEAVIRGFGQPLEAGLRIEAECFNRLLGSPGMTDGIRQFLERDRPGRRPGERR
jgi:enoyl-CoA hydratase